MEQDDLADAGVFELAVTAGEGSQVQIADRTSGKAAELQMHQHSVLRQGNGAAGDVLQHARSDDPAGGDERGFRHPDLLA
jgi:hypothetical protein